MPGQKLIGKHCQQPTATKTGLAWPRAAATATTTTIKWPRTAAAFCEPLYLSDTGMGGGWDLDILVLAVSQYPRSN